MSMVVRYAQDIPTVAGPEGATGADGADGQAGAPGAAGANGADGSSASILPPNPVSAGAGTVLIDLSVSRQWRILLTGNITIDFNTASMVDGDKFQIALTQDGTGGHTITWTPTIRWSRATPPTLSSANFRDVVGFEYYAGAASFDGFIIGGGI